MATLVDTHLERTCVERETDKAIQVRVPNGITGFHDRFVWLPKSQVQWIAEQPQYGETLHLPHWLFRKALTPY